MRSLFSYSPGHDISRCNTQINELPQGSILAPTLFNLYTNANALPPTKSCKFAYADDICSAASTFVEVECTLTADIDQIAEYCHKWHIKPSLTKTVSAYSIYVCKCQRKPQAENHNEWWNY